MRIIKQYWAIIIVIFVYGVLLFLYFNQFDKGLSIKNEKWGGFGDFLGGSLSPIIGIISIVLTYNIINNQNRENRQSEFKYMFAILFDSIDQKRDGIERKVRTILTGGKALNRINKDIKSVYEFQKKQNSTQTELESFRKAFWSVYDDIEASSSPYMKVLHNCLKSIDKNCSSERQEQYSSLLRAQLHAEELIFIFYNGIASDDFSNFKKRIEKYSLLKEINGYMLPSELKSLYDPKAFKENEKSIKKFFHYNRNFSFEFKFTFNRK
jgi:hypothetical protein